MTTLRAGDLAFLDTFAGLVPVKVLEVTEGGNGWHATGGSAVVKVTATRGVYKRGDVEKVSHVSQIIPRSHVRTVRGSGAFRVNVNYTVSA